MKFEQLNSRLKAKVENITTQRLRRKVTTTFSHISAAAKRWRKQARKFLSKPQSSSRNTSLYPRKRSGKLRESMFYRVKKHIGKHTASITITYGFHEVYSTHSKVFPEFPYGSYLNESGATYGGYRERLTEKLKARIETVIHNSTV